MNTRTEVVQDILKRLNDVQKDDIRNVREQDLSLLHHGFGTMIRNRYKMSENKELLADIGKDNADDASMVLIRDVWQALKDPPMRENLPFDQIGVLPQDSPNMEEAEQLFGNILEKGKLPVYLLLPAVLKMRSDAQGDEELFMEHLRGLSKEYDNDPMYQRDSP